MWLWIVRCICVVTQPDYWITGKCTNTEWFVWFRTQTQQQRIGSVNNSGCNSINFCNDNQSLITVCWIHNPAKSSTNRTHRTSDADNIPTAKVSAPCWSLSRPKSTKFHSHAIRHPPHVNDVLLYLTTSSCRKSKYQKVYEWFCHLLAVEIFSCSILRDYFFLFVTFADTQKVTWCTFLCGYLYFVCVCVFGKQLKCKPKPFAKIPRILGNLVICIM